MDRFLHSAYLHTSQKSFQIYIHNDTARQVQALYLFSIIPKTSLVNEYHKFSSSRKCKDLQVLRSHMLVTKDTNWVTGSYNSCHGNINFSHFSQQTQCIMTTSSMSLPSTVAFYEGHIVPCVQRSSCLTFTVHCMCLPVC